MDQFSTPQKTTSRSVLKEINANEFVKKASSTIQGPVKSPLAIDSDISSIDTDNTLSGFDTTLDSSYQVQNSDTTLSDLLSGLGGLKLNTPHRLPKPNHQDANTSLSSDDEMFQECESGFELDATPVVSDQALNRAHSSNIDHNVFDKTINFSSIAFNSTAGLAATSANLSQSHQHDKEETLFKSTVADQTYESVIDQSKETSGELQNGSIDQSNKIESMSNGTQVEEKMIATVEQPANIEIIVTQDGDSITEQINSSVQLETREDVPQVIPSVADSVELGEEDMQCEERQVEETRPELFSNITQEIETTVDPTVHVNMSETIDADKTLNLDQTIDLCIDTPEKIELTNEDEIEIFSAPKNQEGHKNTTIVMEPTENASEAAESNVNNTVTAIEEDAEEVKKTTEPIKNETMLNETIEIVSKTAEVTTNEMIPAQNESNEMKPFEAISVVETPISSIPAANQSFEAMDVDMDETVELHQPTADLATNQYLIEQPLFNQTVEMTDNDPIDEMPKPDLNVTVDVPTEIVEQKSMEMKEIVSPVVDKPAKVPELNYQPMLNITQDFIEEPKQPAELIQTVDLSYSKENATSPVQVNSVNDTFIKSESPSVFDQIQNMSKEFLSSTRRSTGLNNKSNVSLPNVNLNETIVVDNKLPSINTSYIVSPKTVETLPQSNGLMKSANHENRQIQNQDEFKLPAAPSTTANPFDLKQKSQDFEISDDEFQAPGLILNPNDFDFLLSRGCNSGQINPRDSILERFDPISGRKSIIPASLTNRSEPASIAVSPTVSTILEVDSVSESSPVRGSDLLISISKTPTIQLSASINDRGDNKPIVKLDSSDKTEHSISGEGDNSLASSTTETYETASIGEPLKADVTMSVGLIHDLKMDNMKSLEQDKVEPNLKMNDEHKVKQEMVGDVERKLKEAEAREEALLRRITEKEKALNKMSTVVDNYEKTMVELISEREQISQNYEKQIMQLKTERDANLHHLTSLENTFSDLHIKYEKSKQTAVEVKEKEAKLVEKLDFCQQQMKLQEQRYDKLKNHALSQLEGANAKLEALNKAHTNDMKKLTAQLKKEEISRQSIMEQLAQKTKENDELVKICDELINNGADGS